MSDQSFDLEDGGLHRRTRVLRVKGRLDGETAQRLMEACVQVQANGENLVLNLASVSFLGSSGVGALLALVEQFQEQAGELHFAALSLEARAVIDLLDLTTYLTIHEEEDEAISAIAA
jgi:anti-sigma B factor antagonist